MMLKQPVLSLVVERRSPSEGPSPEGHWRLCLRRKSYEKQERQECRRR